MKFENEDEQKRNLADLVGANKELLNDIINNGSFSAEELEEISKKMDDLIPQLEFWIEQDNTQRFAYDLKNHINWILERFS